MKNKTKEKTNTNDEPKNEEDSLQDIKDRRARVRAAKKSALNKIAGNIEKIYSKPGLQESMIRVRKNLHIYSIKEKDMKEIDKLRSIKKIIKHLEKSWIKRLFKDDKVIEIISTHHAKESIELELDPRETVHNKLSLLYKQVKDAQAKGLASQVRIKGRLYLETAIQRFIYNYNYVAERHNVNTDIWKHVLGAMLFDVPKASMLRVKESIMPDYMPRINEHLQIQINELTTMGEIEAILENVKSAQKRYKKKFGYKNFQRKRKN